MTFRSKVDAGLAVGVGGGVAAMWVGAMFALRQGSNFGWLFLAVAVGVVVLTVPVRYRIEEHELLVRSGVLRWRIPLDAIEAVQPTRNPLGSPAWSLDRLHISYRDEGGAVKFLLVSPERKKAFLREIADRVPELELSDDRLERKGARATFTA